MQDAAGLGGGGVVGRTTRGVEGRVTGLGGVVAESGESKGVEDEERQN